MSARRRVRCLNAPLAAMVLAASVPAAVLVGVTPAGADPPPVTSTDDIWLAPGSTPVAPGSGPLLGAGGGFNPIIDASSDGPYEIVLVASPNVERLRAPAAYAAAQFGFITGISMSVRPGTVARDPFNPAREPGEIVMSTLSLSSLMTKCNAGSSIAGCAGPVGLASAMAVRTYLDGGFVWIGSDYAGSYTGDTLQHLVSHELGHAFNLHHFDGTFEGQTQVMHSSSYAAPSFRSGDINGIRAFSDLGRRDYYSHAAFGGYWPQTISVTGDYTPVAGDFDGNGYTDVFWYAPGPAADALWKFDSAGGHVSVSKSVGGTGYEPFAGDFDGDGYDDIFWYLPGAGVDSIWFGDAAGNMTSITYPTVNGDYRPAAADFDGDGITDILWHKAGLDLDPMWYGTATRGSFANHVTAIDNSYVPVAGDFDGDGKGDVVLYAPGPDPDSAWYGSSTRGAWAIKKSVSVGNLYLANVGDDNQDGIDDITWYGPGRLPDYRWSGTSARTFASASMELGGVHTVIRGRFAGGAPYVDDIIGYRAG